VSRAFCGVVAGFSLTLAAASDYSSDPERTVVRETDSSEQMVGDPITVTATLGNTGSNDVRAFYYADHLPEDIDVTTVAVTVDGAGPADYTYEVGFAGEVYAGTVAHRWVIETPPDFTENQSIESSCVIEYTVTSSTAGSYTLTGYTWAGYDEVAATAVFGYETDAPTLDFTPAEVWVDFAYGGTGVGTYGEPFNTLADALTFVPAGGTIKIKGDMGDSDTDETPRIAAPMRIEAIGGPIRIGTFSGPGKAASGTVVPTGTYTAGGKDVPAGLMGAINLALALAGNEQYDVDDTQVELESEVEEAGTVYEPVMPFTTVEDGLQAAHADSVLAIRLRSEAEIDPESVWGSVPNYTEDEVATEWQPVVEGDLHDVWVIFRPHETWYLDEVISLTVSAETVSGEPVGPVTFQFRTESEEEYFERVTDVVEPVWQPQYDEDFDAESTDTAVLTPAGQQPTSTPLSDGLDAPVIIRPERVYEIPQRVWLPVQEGIETSEVELYYYHPAGDNKGWYPAETVAGWLVPDSYLELDLDGTTYLGFLVRHAGIVQLRMLR